MQKRYLFVLACLPILISCQQEMAPVEEGNVQMPPPLVQAGDGNLYSPDCLSELGLDAKAECQFSLRMFQELRQIPQADRRGHNGNRWWRRWQRYFSYWNNYGHWQGPDYGFSHGIPYYNLSWYPSGGWCASYGFSPTCYDALGPNNWRSITVFYCDGSFRPGCHHHGRWGGGRYRHHDDDHDDDDDMNN